MWNEYVKTNKKTNRNEYGGNGANDPLCVVYTLVVNPPPAGFVRALSKLVESLREVSAPHPPPAGFVRASQSWSYPSVRFL